METWATFSIIDHRAPVYRQALAMFDRIVVPVPPAPIGDQTQEELTQLNAEVSWLEKNGAAKLYEWSSDDFAEWRKPILAGAVASHLNRDPYRDTRMMMSEKLSAKDVQAVPVYGGEQEYTLAKATLGQVEEALTIEVVQRLPVPEHDTPFDNLIKLRNDPAFRNALDELLEWKRMKAPAIFLAADRHQAMAAAMKDFDTLSKNYAAAMESQGFKKAGSVGSIFYALLKGDVFDLLKEGLVSFREVREPCWKKVSELKCAPGGVVYHFREALR